MTPFESKLLEINNRVLKLELDKEQHNCYESSICIFTLHYNQEQETTLWQCYKCMRVFTKWRKFEQRAKIGVK